jgi:hypothetical protein
VRVLRRGAGTQVRFALAAPGLDYRVTVEPGALVLTIYEPTGR